MPSTEGLLRLSLALSTTFRLNAVLTAEEHISRNRVTTAMEQEDIVKVNDRNIQLSASSLEIAFDDFISGYAYLLEPHDRRDDPKDIAIFHLLNVLNEDFHGMTSKDIKSVQKVVVDFIRSQHLNKSALFDFKDELGFNSGDKNKGGNK